jgi:uncharacterized OsmC-like protein
MKNGLNIALVSELVHELQIVPEEALVRLRTQASPLGPVVQCETLTLSGGTVRVARDFRFRTAAQSLASSRVISFHEQLLVALGGCVLVTFVQGCSARGFTLMKASVVVSARVSAGGDGLATMDDIAYEYDIECDGPADTLVEIAKYVSCLSPNHRAFLERAGIRIDAQSTASKSPVSFTLEDVLSAPSLSSGERAVRREVRVNWLYGTQLLAQAPSGDLLVDQPKQYLGLDSAANPQEYLLAAAAAEFAHELQREAARNGTPLNDITISSGGSLDLRGLTNLDSTKPVRVHDIAHSVRLESPVRDQALASMTSAAARRCLAHALICREQTIQVSVRASGEPVATFRSDQAMLQAYLADLERRKQEAAGNR